MFRKAKHGMLAAGRDLERLTPRQRKEAWSWYEAVEERAMQYRVPPPFSLMLELSIVLPSLEITVNNPLAGAAGIAVNLGYAARTTQRNDTSEIAAWSDPSLNDLVLRDDDGTVLSDFDAYDDERFGDLRHYVTSRALDDDAFADFAHCEPALWFGFTTIAAMQLHKNMKRNGWGRVSTLPVGMVDQLLRLGYVLRGVDEAIGQEPQAAR